MLGWLLAAAGMLLLARCDTVEPGEAGALVVEAFFDAGRPLPVLTLRQTLPLDAPYADDDAPGVVGAEVEVRVDGALVPYEPVAGTAGRYGPTLARDVLPRSRFEVEVRWEGQHAAADGVVPPPVALDSVQVRAPARPVQAVLLDSLRLTDSLGVAARQGLIYPVEVTLWWTSDLDEAGADSLFWVQMHLRPFTRLDNTNLDFFLRPEQVVREQRLPRDARGRRRWTGVYAVPVARVDDPLPAHGLRVALLRSGPDYARFALSRNAPQRREPLSNVRGALGIVAGIALDSLRVEVTDGDAR